MKQRPKRKNKRDTEAQTLRQIIADRIPHLTIEQRVASLEEILCLLVEKHNALGEEFEQRADRHQHLIEALLIDTLDLQTHIHGPDPEILNHPDVQALRRKHDDDPKPTKAASRSANIIDFAAHRKDDP